MIVQNSKFSIGQQNSVAAGNLTIDGSGNVGIGSTSPYSALNVRGANTANGNAKRLVAFFDTTSAAAGTGAGIALGGFTNGTGGDINDLGIIQGIKENGSQGNYASALTFQTRANGAGTQEQMRISSTGKVGIGVTIPEAKLHVYGGNSSVAPTTSADDFFIESGGHTGMTIGSGTTSHGNIYFGDSGDVARGIIRYDHSADTLGMGAVGSATHLSINSSGHTTFAGSQVMYSDGNVSILSTKGLYFDGGSNTYMKETASDQLAIYTGGSERFRINAQGNIIIAHTAPGGMSSSSYKQIALNSGAVIADSGGTNSAFMLLQNAYVGASNNNYRTVNSNASRIMMTTGDISFATAGADSPDSGITWTTQMFIDQTQSRVGIGNTSPSYKLDVTGTGRFTTDLTVDNRIGINTAPDAFLSLKTDTDGSNAIIALDHDGNGLMRLRDSGAAALFNLYDGGVEKITFDADGTSFFNAGNVGIGNTAPAQKLHVTGNMRVETGEIQIATSGQALVFSDGNCYISRAGNAMRLHAYAGHLFTINGETAVTIDNGGHLSTSSGNNITTGGVFVATGDLDLYSGGNKLIGATNTNIGLLRSTTVSGNMTVTGTVTAQEFRTEYLTETVIATSGSTKWGNTADDIHQFTGSLKLQGTADFGSGGELKVSKISGRSPLHLDAAGDRISASGSLVSTGNVGIGTIPNEELSIFHATDPEMRFRINTHGTAAVLLGNADGLMIYGQGASNQIRFHANTTEKFRVDSGGAILRSNNTFLYGVTSGAATVSLIGVRNDNWMILGNAGYGFVWANGAGSIDGAGNVYWTKPNTYTGGNGALNGNGSNLGGSYDLYIGSQSSGKGSRIILNAGHTTGEFVMQARQSTGYGNGNIGFYRRTAVTSYTTLMHIGGDGKIGIGTESPSRKFVVSTGSDTYAQIETTSATNDAWLRFANTGDNTESTNFRIGRTHDGRFDIGAGDGTHHMSVTSGGNVGIGTPGPDGQLHLFGGGNDTTHRHLVIGNNTNNNPSHANIWFKTGAGDIAKIQAQQAAGGQYGRICLLVGDNGAPAIKATLEPSGEFTIGEPLTANMSITGILNVNAGVGGSGQGTSRDNVIVINQNTNGVNKPAVEFGIVVQNGGASTNASGLTIGTANGGSMTERMRIQHDGNVGIGQANPERALDITSSTGDMLVIRGASGNHSPQIRFTRNLSSYHWYMGMHQGSGLSDFFFRNSAGDKILALQSGGNVGIGLSTPNVGLDIRKQTHSWGTGQAVKRYAADITGLVDGSTAQYYTIGTIDLTGLTYSNGWLEGWVTQGRSFQDNPLYKFKLFFYFTTGTATVRFKSTNFGAKAGWLKAYVDSSTQRIIKLVAFNNFANQVGMAYDIKYWNPAGSSFLADADISFITSATGASSTSAPSGYNVVAYQQDYEDLDNKHTIFDGEGFGTKVGIGTSNPSSKLELAFSRGTTLPSTYDVTDAQSSAPYDDEFVIKNTSNNNAGSFASLFFYAGQQAGTAALAGVGRITLRKSSASNFVSQMGFWTRKSDGDMNQNMVIDSDGQVGIGTSNPDTTLDVHGAVTVDGNGGQAQLKLRADDGDSQAIYFTNATSGYEGAITYTNTGTTAEKMDFYVNQGTRMTLLASGNVGIGTNTPDSMLEVRRDETGTQSNVKGNINYSAITIQGDYTNGSYLPALAWSTADNVATAPKAGIYVKTTNAGSTMILGTSNAYGSGITNEGIAIDPTGQVGIGTDTPIRMLDIVASSGDPGIRLESAAQSADVITLRNADGRVGFGRDAITTVTSGDVGIGNASPQVPLQVGGSTNGISFDLMPSWNRMFLGQNVKASSTNGRMVRIASSTTDYPSAIAFGYQDVAGFGSEDSKGGINFITVGSNISGDIDPDTYSRMYIHKDGNVGIGTTTPADPLHIYSTGGCTVNFDTNGASNWRVGATTTGGGYSTGNAFAWYCFDDTSYKMTISTSGNVGIGDTTPSEKLEVNGNVKINNSIIFGGQNMKIVGNTSTPALELRGGVSGQVRVYCDETLRWTFDDGGDLSSSGNHISTGGKMSVGSGTESQPGYQLGSSNDGFFHDGGIKVVVNNAVDFLMADGGTFHADADVVAYSTTISDERLKDDVKTIDSALDKVKRLRGVEYVWSHGSKKGQKDIGVIAQETEKVIPEIVQEKEMPLWSAKDPEVSGKYKMVDYEKLTAVLIESVKEQQKQIDELKSELQELKDGSSR